jgi:hypothetical protein
MTCAVRKVLHMSASDSDKDVFSSTYSDIIASTKYQERLIGIYSDDFTAAVGVGLTVI